MHIGAIKNVLEMSRAANVHVSDAIKRALFWQDLYSCLFVGTTRLVSHRDYEEFTSETFLSLNQGYSIPPGFEKIASSFPAEFVEVLIDLNALCHHVDLRCAPGHLPLHECPIDNFQYNIESRLVDLLSHDRASGQEDFILQACIFACFLIAYQLSTGIWEGCFIPEYCATQVMSLLRKTKDDRRWEHHDFKDLLLWLLFVSGALAKRNRIRLRARNMIHGGCRGFLEITDGRWESMDELLQKFVWSSHSMEKRTRQFWHEIHSPRQDINRSKDEEPILMHPTCIQLRIRQSEQIAGKSIVGAA